MCSPVRSIGGSGWGGLSRRPAAAVGGSSPHHGLRSRGRPGQLGRGAPRRGPGKCRERALCRLSPEPEVRHASRGRRRRLPPADSRGASLRDAVSATPEDARIELTACVDAEQSLPTRAAAFVRNVLELVATPPDAENDILGDRHQTPGAAPRTGTRPPRAARWRASLRRRHRRPPHPAAAGRCPSNTPRCP